VLHLNIFQIFVAMTAPDPDDLSAQHHPDLNRRGEIKAEDDPVGEVHLTNF
jgi:hypothetical protein